MIKVSKFLIIWISFGCILLGTGCLSTNPSSSQTNNNSMPSPGTIATIPTTTGIIPHTCNLSEDTTPFITINSIGNHTADEVFFINGTTNLNPAGGPLSLTISPTSMTPAGFGSTYSSNATIQRGTCGVNFWSANASPTSNQWVTFTGAHTQSKNVTPGEYIAEISSESTNVTQFQYFDILPEPVARGGTY